MSVQATELPAAGAREGRRLGRGTILLYGVGGVSLSVKTVLVGLYGLFFYTSVMGLSSSLVGLAGAIGLAWDAFIDPYIGYLSDRSQSSLGRRHGFMLVGALTMGVGFWLSFAPPQALSTVGLFAWVLVSGIAVRTALSLFTVPYFALGAELSQDYDQRTAIVGVRALVAMVGTMLAAGLSFVLFFPTTTPGVDPKLNYAGYPAMGLAVGFIMTLTALVATLGTLSRRAYLPREMERHQRQSPRDLFANLLQSLRYRSSQRLYGSYSLFYLGVVVSTTLSVYYLTYYARITESRALSAFQVAFYLAGLLGAPVWVRLSGRGEKHHVYGIGAAALAALMLGSLVLIGEGRVLGVGNVGGVLLFQSCAGFFGGILWILPPSLMADVADEDELATGRRREGVFFGLFSFSQQVATGLSVLLVGVLLDRFAGLVPGRAVQSPETVERIGLLFGGLSAALLLVAATLMIRYPLHRQRVRAIQRSLAAKGRAAREGDSPHATKASERHEPPEPAWEV